MPAYYVITSKAFHYPVVDVKLDCNPNQMYKNIPVYKKVIVKIIAAP